MHRSTVQLFLLIGMFVISCGRSSSDTQSAAMPVPDSIVQLTVGEDAPMFTLPGTPDGEEIILSEVLEDKPVLLAFFPKAFTGG